jgi:hypothetical protein
MKKITLLLLLFCVTGLSYGQYLTEDFEGGASIPAGWTLNQTNTNETWYIGTNAAQANTGSNYAIVEYDAALGNQDESLTTPTIDLTSATNPRLVFWWNASYFWAVDPNDNYDFTVSIDDGSTVTQVFTETDETEFDSTDDNFVWFQRTVDLSAYVGETITITFNYTGADGASLTIDDVTVEETPTCPNPTGVMADATSTTEATISWMAGGSETEWTYEYGVTGFTQGAGTSATVNTTSANLSSLTPGETYDVYVQANCGPGDDSTWTSVVMFTMPVPPPVNDVIGGAIPITPSPQGTGCGTAQFTLNFSTDGTTDSGLDGTCNTTDTGLDQFFTWTATTEGLLWNDAAPGNPGIIIRDAAGNEITCEGTFASDDIILSGWNIGQDLIIQIYDFGGSVSDVAFCLEEYTPPAPIVPNYSATFDSYPQEFWSEASGPYGTPSGASSSFTGDDFANDTGSSNGTSARVNIFSTSIDEYLISPEFNLSAATYYLNFDIALTAFDNTNAATMGVDDYVALLVTEDGGANWTELARWDSSTTISNTGESVPEIVLSGYGAEVQFAFYAFSDTSNVDNDFFIDNFQITDTTLSTGDDTIEGFSVYPTIVQQDLNFNALENVKQLSVYNLLGQEVFRATPNISNSSVDLSSLKAGMYMVRVQVGDAIGTYKIIKE